MFTIDLAELKKAGATVEGNAIYSEASCMGLAPGEWPDFIAALNERNEGFLFLKEAILELEGRYSTKDGKVRLCVLND